MQKLVTNNRNISIEMSVDFTEDIVGIVSGNAITRSNVDFS